MEQSKNKWKNIIIPLVVLCFFLIFVVNVIPWASCDGETSVNVKFEILTGSGTSDYFTGDYFWYNVTLTNSGTTDINATFTVTVRNTTGGILPQVETYEEYLKPNDTTTLYPNYTRLGKDEVYIYFMDTVGTYAVELNCDKPMTFYRYYNTGAYTVSYNLCRLDIDVMPSYQKVQNDMWNQSVQQSESYLNNIQTYLAQSRVEASNTKMLADISLAVAVLAIMVNLFTLPKTRFKEHKRLIAFILLGLVLYIIIAFFIF